MVKPLVGVLLNRRILQRGVRGSLTFEKLSLYVKAARELGVNVVFFETAGVDTKREKVLGYVPVNEKLKRRTVPLPSVVHKRGLFRRREDVKVIRRMEDLNVYMFNPQIRWDKYQIHQALMKEPRLHPYLPESVLPNPENVPWFQKHLNEGAEVFVKPRRGSLGLGIARVWRIRPGIYRYESQKVRRKTSFAGAWHLVNQQRKTHFLQQGIALLEDEGQRVDFRVPVQRDGENRWHIAGIAAKRARKGTFLTNFARGGSVHNGGELLTRSFGQKQADIIVDHMMYVSTLVAQTINAYHAQLVDLGLDIGVDKQGHPFLIEVNRRCLRVLLDRSGQQAAFETLYKNPIAYARYLVQQKGSFQ